LTHDKIQNKEQIKTIARAEDLIENNRPGGEASHCRHYDR
jgi:hypothetical protein